MVVKKVIAVVILLLVEIPIFIIPFMALGEWKPFGISAGFLFEWGLPVLGLILGVLFICGASNFKLRLIFSTAVLVICVAHFIALNYFNAFQSGNFVSEELRAYFYRDTGLFVALDWIVLSLFVSLVNVRKYRERLINLVQKVL